MLMAANTVALLPPRYKIAVHEVTKSYGTVLAGLAFTSYVLPVAQQAVEAPAGVEQATGGGGQGGAEGQGGALGAEEMAVVQ